MTERTAPVTPSHREPVASALAYRVPQVCAMLGISRATFYRRVETGEIAIHKLGGITLVKRASLERIFDALAAAPHDATPDLAGDMAQQSETGRNGRRR